jgi:hypothetical protein
MMMEESQTPPTLALPRLRCADREREDPLPRRIDDLMDDDPPARIVWAFVSGLDLAGVPPASLRFYTVGSGFLG